jgi:hypothetical protein
MGVKFTSVLNAIHYILTVLQEWCEHPHYIQLSWYHEQYGAMIADTSLAPLDMTTNTVTDMSISALETSKSYTFSALSLFSGGFQDQVDEQSRSCSAFKHIMFHGLWVVVT